MVISIHLVLDRLHFLNRTPGFCSPARVRCWLRSFGGVDIPKFCPSSGRMTYCHPSSTLCVTCFSYCVQAKDTAQYRLETTIACAIGSDGTATNPMSPVRRNRHGESDCASRGTRCAPLGRDSATGIPLASLMTCITASTSTGYGRQGKSRECTRVYYRVGAYFEVRIL